MQAGVRGLDARLTETNRRLQTIGSGLGLRMQRAAEVTERGFSRATSRISLQLQRVAEGAERRMVQAAERSGRAWSRAAALASRAAASVSSGIGRAGIAAGGGIAQIGGALSGALTGGFGGLVSGAGNIAAIGTQTAGAIVGSLSSGLLGAVPVVGRALGGLVEGAARAAAGLVGGAVQAVTTLAVSLVNSILSTVKIGLAAGLGLAVVAGVRAAKGEQVRAAFDAFTEGIGEDATAALDRFKVATRGAVDEINLMLQFNRALQLGAVKNSEEFAKLSRAAITLGIAMGRGPVEAMEDLAIGLGRGSRLVLDNLGIIVSAEAAYEKYAASIGKSTAELTFAEKRTAFQAEAIEQLTRNTDRLDRVTDTTAFRFAKFRAAISDLVERAGRPLLQIFDAILPSLTRIARRFSEFLDENHATIARRIADAIQGIPDALANAAEFFERHSFGEIFDQASAAVDRLSRSIGTELRATLREATGELEAFAVEAKATAADAIDFLGLTGTFEGRTRGQAAREEAANIRTRARLEADFIRTPFVSPALAPSAPISGAGPVRVIVENAEEIRGPVALPGGGGGLFPPLAGLRDPLLSRLGGIFERFTGLPGQLVLSQPLARSDDAVQRELARTAAQRDVFGAAERLGVPITLRETGGVSTERLRATSDELAEIERRRQIDRDVTAVYGKILDSTRDRLDRTERTLADAEGRILDATRRKEAAAREIVEIEERIAETRRESVERQRETLEQLAEQFKRSVDGIVAQFRSFSAGGLGASDRDLPANIRRGVQRREGLESRQIRNQLRFEFGDLSAGQVARLGPEDFARLEARVAELRIGQQRPLERARDRVADVTAGRALAPEIKEAAEETRATTEKALGELEAATTEAIGKMEEEIEIKRKEVETLHEFITQVEGSLEASKALHEKTTKELNDITEKIKVMTIALNNLRS